MISSKPFHLCLIFVSEEASVYLIILPMSFFILDELTLAQYFKTFFLITYASTKRSRLGIPSKPFQLCQTFVSEDASVYLKIITMSLYVRNAPTLGQFLKMFSSKLMLRQNEQVWVFLPNLFNIV